jgi:hypothetical protein
VPGVDRLALFVDRRHLREGERERTHRLRGGDCYGRRQRRRLQSEGDRAGAEREVRGVWQSAEMSAELETAVSNEFAGVLTSTDDVTRMDKRI